MSSGGDGTYMRREREAGRRDLLFLKELRLLHEKHRFANRVHLII